MRLISAVLFVFFASATFLAAADKLSTEELLHNLKDSNPKIRAEAAQELGDRGEKLGLMALVDTTADKDPNVQLAAVEAIGKINSPDHVSALTQAIRNTNGQAQKEAIQLLTEHYIPGKDRNALMELFATIEELFNPPHPAIVEPWIRVDPEAVDVLTSVMDNKASTNRVLTAATLGILRADSALPRLTFYLKSPNEQMVRTCIRSIGYIGRTEAGADLIPLLKHSDDKIVFDAARVLGQFHYKPALPELQHLLEYSNKDEYRRVALQAISRVGDPSSEGIMKKYFSSEDPFMRQYAIEGFGRMGLRGYADPLERNFQTEKQKQLKLAEAFSLFALGDHAYIETLVRTIDERMYRDQVREYLFELGPKAVPKMADYLKGSDKDLKIRLIRTLGDMRQPQAIPYIEPYLKDHDLEVAQAATDAVRELRQIT